MTREPSNEPFRPPDVGTKEIRPDVWKVVHDNVDAVPLGRDHLDEAPEKNPHYVHDLAQIDPHNPTGLEAAPHTQDTHPVEV